MINHNQHQYFMKKLFPSSVFSSPVLRLPAIQRAKKYFRALYKSSDLTAVNSFTSGAEGPAVDKDGNLYAVNYSKEGTIGKITPSGDSSIFIELPNGSIGNGIRFNSKGEMMIADYTNHNILKVDMTNKQISVYAHDSTMNQPNDIAIDNKDRLYASDPNWKAWYRSHMAHRHRW